jgi:UDP-2,3-diacylglucosamine hydrolase
MTTLFISDLHLDASRPHITRQFLEFLEREAASAKALYILGDLFEAWIGDDVSDDVGDAVADGLAKLHSRGVPCFYIHGNRDFLIGDAYARRARMTLLPDPSIVEIAGKDVLLMHGDSLCTDDRAYQEFKAQVRDPSWQRQFFARSIREREQFAARARAESQRYTRSARDTLMDVNADAVVDILRHSGTLRLIHGHTHRPARHEIDVNAKTAERIVLGDWYEQGSVLRVAPDRIELTTL